MRSRSLSPVDRLKVADQWRLLSPRSPEWRRLLSAYIRWNIVEVTAKDLFRLLHAVTLDEENHFFEFDQFYWGYLDMRVRGDI